MVLSISLICPLFNQFQQFTSSTNSLHFILQSQCLQVANNSCLLYFYKCQSKDIQQSILHSLKYIIQYHTHDTVFFTKSLYPPHDVQDISRRGVQQPSKNSAYLLKAPSVKSLILINPNSYSLMKNHISNIEELTTCKLTHVLSHQGPHNSQLIQQIPKDVKIFTPDQKGDNVGKDLLPFSVGELSICYLDFKGLKKQKSVICVTHVTDESTKLPVIFPQKIFGVCSVNDKQIVNKLQYLKSLQKLRNFPGESLIFPSIKVLKSDLEFALALDPENLILQNKIKMFDAFTQDDRLLPTTLIQQKNSNPFFRPSYYSQILKSSNKTQNFSKLIKLSHAYNRQ